MSRPSPERRQTAAINTAISENGTVSNTTLYYNVYERVHNSEPTPDYHMLALRGLLPENPYTSTVTRIENSHYTARTTYTYDGRFYAFTRGSVWHSMGALPLSLQPGYLVAEAENKAFRRMHSQLNDVQVNIAQFFGERKQLANMLATTVERVSAAALALRRADLNGLRRSLGLTGTESRRAALNWRRVEETKPWKRIPSFWLEYIYGWRPLLSDVRGAAELLAQQVVGRKYNSTVRATGNSWCKTATLSPRSGNSHFLYDTYSSHSVKVRAKAKYYLENEGASLLSETGISNPLLLAWELLPYSFVVDWFVPVGNYLESLTAFDGFTFDKASVSTLENSGMTGQVGYYKSPTGHPEVEVSEFNGGSGCASTQCRYTLKASLPAFRPYLKSPIGGEPLERFATAMSLLANLFQKLEKPPRYF